MRAGPVNKVTLVSEIKKRAQLVTKHDDAGLIVTIRMDEIEAAVKAWDKHRRERAKMFRRSGLQQRFK